MRTINVYSPDNRAPKYMKQKSPELKRKIDSSIIVVGYFHILLSTMGRTTKQNSKEIEDLNNTINKLDLKDTYKILHLKPA